jgi:hypothetical protein
MRPSGPSLQPDMRVECIMHGMRKSNLLGPKSRLTAAAVRPARTALRAAVRWAAAPVALVGLAGLLGCQDPLVRERLSDRQRTLRWTCDTLAYRETHAGERLHRTDEYVRDNWQRDVANTRRDASAVRAYIEFDVQRFEERQSLYRDEALEILYGKPQNLRPMVILMFL